MSGYGSYNQASSDSQAYSGLRGTGYQDDSANQAYSRGLQLNKVADNNQNMLNPQGQTQYMMGNQGITGQQMLPSGQYGLGSNADLAMQKLGSQMFGYQSGNLAARGMVSPENQGAVVGSAITQALPQLLPQIQQWQQAQFMAPLQIGQYALQNSQAAADYWNRALGGQSQSSANSFGFAGGGGAMPSEPPPKTPPGGWV